MSPAGPLPHFFVLPDSDTGIGSSVAATLTVAHGSGRPWIVFGGTRTDRLLVAREAGLAVVLIGQFLLTEQELGRIIGRIQGLEDLDAAGLDIPGSFHLVATDGDRIRAQGSASGVRRLFYTRVAGAGVVSDRSDMLAAVAGANLDTAIVATRLVHPVPWPLTERTAWREIEAVPPGDAVIVADNGRSLHSRRWWQPPLADLDSKDGGNG